MSASGLLLLAAFLVGAAAFVLWPFIAARWLGREDAALEPPLRLISKAEQLQAEHEALLRAVRDLDFDFETDQVGEEDYHLQREALMQRGVEILQQIDEIAAEEAEPF